MSNKQNKYMGYYLAQMNKRHLAEKKSSFSPWWIVLILILLIGGACAVTIFF